MNELEQSKSTEQESNTERAYEAPALEIHRLASMVDGAGSFADDGNGLSDEPSRR